MVGSDNFLGLNCVCFFYAGIAAVILGKHPQKPYLLLVFVCTLAITIKIYLVIKSYLAIKS